MNSTPRENNNQNSPKSNQALQIIIIILLSSILISGIAFFAYYITQIPNMNNTSKAGMTMSSNSDLSQSTMMVSSSSSAQIISSVQTNTQTLSCPTFEFLVNLDKYQVGFTKFTDEWISSREDKSSIEEAMQELLKSQKINCVIDPANITSLVLIVEKGYENGCWFCGPGNIKSLNFIANYPEIDENKVISTNPIKNINNLEGSVRKMFRQAQDDSEVNYNSITFKIKGIDYQITTASKSTNPTDAENEILLKDALELFNTIKVK